MAYEYGSADLGIKNPFKFEGLCRTLRGALVAGLGLLALLAVQGKVESGLSLEGWVNLACGVLLCLLGLAGLGRGLFQMMRFYVGRGVPANLARNLSRSERHARQTDLAYDPQHLEQMVVGRKNLTFHEPQDWLARMVHSCLPGLLFLPAPVRALTQRTFNAIIFSLLAALAYGLAWFSSSTGLTAIGQTPVLDWLGLVLLSVILLIWWRQRRPLPSRGQEGMDSTGVKGMVGIILLAIFSPFALNYVHLNIGALPEVGLPVGEYLFALCCVAGIAAAFSLGLSFQRAKICRPITEVSEYRSNWQESAHPQEIFINFENIIMANRRYQEIPNRVYLDFDARLIEEGSNDKGKFSGEMIQETQPVFEKLPATPLYQTTRRAGTVAGQLLLAAAGVLLYLAIPELARSLQNPAALSQVLFYPLLLGLFGSLMANHVHVFWAEMQFTSLLVFFQCQGTYTESKISTGAAIHDSTRSENVVVRSSMTPWVIATRLLTTTFSGSGSRNLEGARHILELRKADADLNAIMTELREFLGNRQTIASINAVDYNSASTIFQINEASRAPRATISQTSELSADAIGPAPLPTEQEQLHSDRPTSAVDL